MINQKPSQHIVATQPIKAGGLALVPLSQSVTFAVPCTTCKTMQQLIADTYTDPADHSRVLHIAPYYTPPTPNKPTVGRVVPFWAVERLDASKAGSDGVNCEIMSYYFSTATVHPPVKEYLPGHAQRRVDVPVLMLAKDVGEGDRLQWCDASWVLPEKQAKAVRANKKVLDDAVAGEARGTKRSRASICGPQDVDGDGL